MSKTLLFGNGISLNFAKSEFSYESLMSKFVKGLEISLKSKLGQWKNKEIIDVIIDFLKKNKNYNEGTFWDIFLKIVIHEIENYGEKQPNHYLNLNLSTPKELIDCIFKIIDENKEVSNFGSYVWQYFLNAYNVMRYAIFYSIGIGQNYLDGFVKIPYSGIFLEYCRSFETITTTNYITNLEQHGLSIEYLHGKIKNKDNFKFDLYSKTNSTIGKGNEFYLDTKLLFGRNYNDKIRLNSCLNWIGEDLKRIDILEKDNFKKHFSDEVVILGMSIEADQDLFRFILDKCTKCTVYYYTEKDKKEWEVILNKNNAIDKAEMFCAKTLPFIK